MTKVVIVGSSLKIGSAVAGSAGPIPAPLPHSANIGHDRTERGVVW